LIPGALAERRLPDGRILTVVPLLTGTARLTVGTDEQTYDNGY
jgi:hypothetical protein